MHKLIPSIFYLADQKTRSEFSMGEIVREPDYVQRLITRVRDELEASGLSVFAEFRVAHGRKGTAAETEEQKFGCDAIVVIRFGDEARVGLIEAKRIRPNFDYPQGRVSHFCSQIERQSRWISSAFICEMIIDTNETDIPGFDVEGCTCIWHTAANIHRVFSSGLAEWKKTDIATAISLQELLTATIGPSRGNNIASFVEHMIFSQGGLQHESGEPCPINGQPMFGGTEHPIMNGRILLTSVDGETIDIPCERNGDFQGLLESIGLTSFLCVDLGQGDEVSSGPKRFLDWVFPDYGDLQSVVELERDSEMCPLELRQRFRDMVIDMKAKKELRDQSRELSKEDVEGDCIW